MQKPKVGGKDKLSVLISGNADVIDCLLSQQEDGGGLEPGLRRLVQEKAKRECDITSRHVPGFRSDVLLQTIDQVPVPQELMSLGLDQHPFIEAQLRGLPARDGVDILVLSIEPDVTQNGWKHQQSGFLLCTPSAWETECATEQREWLRAAFAPAGLVEVEAFKENFIRLVKFAKERLDAHVLVFNCCTIDPNDNAYSYRDQHEDTLTVRVQKFNRALIEISILEGISIIDADRLISELGAGAHVPEALRYSVDGCRTLGKEFVRVVEDIGFFEKRPLVMQVGRQGK